VSSATVTINVVPENDVSVTQVDDHGGSSINGSVGTVVPGLSLAYTVTVSNAGPSTAMNVGVSDPVPTGISTFVWSGNGHTNVSGAISDTIASLAPGASVTYTVFATVDPVATGTLTNTATVTAANDSNPANNTATDTDNLLPESDLSITKTDGQVTYRPGTQNTYTIVVSNNGPSTATSVAVTDIVPAALTGVSWSSTNGSSGTGNLNDKIASLAPFASVTYTLTATVDPAATGNLVNSASVTAAAVDVVPGNNSATDLDTPAPVSDLSVTKVDDQGGSSTSHTVGTVSPGQSFTYTVTVSNAGPSTAMNVGVSDPVPTGISTFVWSGNGHTNVSGAISDTIASLAPGASVTYTVSVTVDSAATGTLTNTATVTPAAGTTDPNPNNNTATDTDTVASPAPKITSSPTDQTCSLGGLATFTASATGTPTPTIQWQVSTDGGATYINLGGGTSSTLTIACLSASLNGNLYRAVFTNPSGSATTSAAKLTVT
jgi:uncharacterized repeat protein (TIGR01451 family)